MLSSLFFLLCGCTDTDKNDDGKLKIVATLFPQYDFVKEIAGEYASVSLLLPSGVESHSYEPTPQDIIGISEADIFLYTGEYMEAWAHDIIEGIDSDVMVIDVSKGISLDTLETHDEHPHFDPHIWTDPELAITMVQNIADALCSADSDNASVYIENADTYCAKLSKLDSDMKEMLSCAKQDTVCFGDRFAMHYFAKHYGLNYISAYDSCSEETEPSAKAIAQIIDTIKEKGITAVFHGELTKPTVAQAIANDTGAQLLLLHSCHNVSKEEFECGASYLSLMYQNLENLREGLK